MITEKEVPGLYQALYRKWRPQTFDDVIGQSHITDSLKNQVQSGRLSHAYIFIGTRGTGKTSCARILAKAVNCEHPVNGNPCCKCASCQGIAEGSVVDIVELDAASNNGVDNVRALREEAVFSPATAKKRVYIIDEVHMLSTSAFNALLKILEEPPEHLLFILATTELQKVPATILSRCQRHSFRRIDTEVLSEYLCRVAEKENLTLSREAAQLIAQLSEGGVRDSLSMLDQCSSYGSIGIDEVYAAVGLAGNKRTLDIFEMICAHNTAGAIDAFNLVWMDGKDPASFLRELSSLVRDILMLKVAPKNASALIYGGYDMNMLKEYASRFTTQQLSGTLSSIQETLAGMRDGLNPKMSAELCLISLCTEVAGNSLEGLRARVSGIENLLKKGVPVGAPEQAHPVTELNRAPAPAPEAPAVPAVTAQEPIASAVPPAAAPEPPAEQPGGEAAFSAIEEAAPAALQEEPLPENFEPAPAKAAVAEPAAAGENALQSTTESAPTAENFWPDLLEEAKPGLPPFIVPVLKEASKAYLDGDKLVVEVESGFYLTQTSRPENVDKLTAAAKKVLGREIAVRVTELKKEVKPPRDLSYFRQFPEVQIINKKN